MPALAAEIDVPVPIGVLVSSVSNQVKLYPEVVMVPSASCIETEAAPSGVTQSVNGESSTPSTVKLAGVTLSIVIETVSE